MVEKRFCLAAIRTRVEQELASATRIAREAAESATHEENRPENDKDMRSTEASYIARGQAERVRVLSHAEASLTSLVLREFSGGATIEVSAMFELVHRDQTNIYFLLPAAGGERATVDGVTFQTITTTSPLGAALLGLSEGDDAEVRTPQGDKVYRVGKVW